jgi:hypothetical protein
MLYICKYLIGRASLYTYFLIFLKTFSGLIIYSTNFRFSLYRSRFFINNPIILPL